MAAMFSTGRVRHAGAMTACAHRLFTQAATLHAINPATRSRYPRSQFQPALIADRYSMATRAVLPHRACFSVRSFRTRDATRTPTFHDAAQREWLNCSSLRRATRRLARSTRPRSMISQIVTWFVRAMIPPEILWQPHAHCSPQQTKFVMI